MRFLVVGAGAIGGYFGGRLVAKGEDVTFLVRPKRQANLEQHGLAIRSIHGNLETKVKTITNKVQGETFDCILLSVKAYHLPETLQDLTPFIHENTVILPLLNGYEHYAILQEKFGASNVLGGLCFIETTLNEQGQIIQTSPRHDLYFGELAGALSERVLKLEKHLANAGFVLKLCDNMLTEIWYKYIFIATLSGVTTLTRAPIGPIVARPEGQKLVENLLREIMEITQLVDAPLPANSFETLLEYYRSLAYGMKSSMQRDMEKGLLVEADHFHGYLLRLAKEKGNSVQEYPYLSAVYANLKIYAEQLVEAH